MSVTSPGGAGAELPTGRVYGGRSAEERRAARRAALVATAYDLFGTVGYRQVAIDRLCTGARVTARHFYEEFPDREALLRAVYDVCAADVLEAVLAAVDGVPDDARSRVEAGIGAFVTTMLVDPRRARIICLEAVGVSDDLERHRRRRLGAFADLVAEEARHLAAIGQVAARPDHRLAALALVGAVNELIVHWLHAERPPPIEVLTDELVRLFLAAAAGPPGERADDP